MAPRQPTPVLDRPSGLIDRLDGAFAVLRQRARVIVGIAFVFVVPASVLQAWVSRDDFGGLALMDVINDPVVAEQAGSVGAVYDLPFVLGQLLNLLAVSATGVAVARVVDGWHHGRDVTAGEALRYTFRRSGAVLGAFLLVHLLELVGMVLVLPGLAALVLCSLTSPVLAIEELGPVASVRRSAALVRLRFGPVVGIMVLCGLASYAVSQAVASLPTLVAVFVGFHWAWPLLAVSNLLVALITVPVTVAAMTLTYHDIRFRTEGLDLRARMEDTWS